MDATADPNYAFADLKNLVIRARNELGVAITFQQDPEPLIRPRPSPGFSRSHFVIKGSKKPVGRWRKKCSALVDFQVV